MGKNVNVLKNDSQEDIEPKYQNIIWKKFNEFKMNDLK